MSFYNNDDIFLGDRKRIAKAKRERKKQLTALLFALILLLSSGFLNWLLEYTG